MQILSDQNSQKRRPVNLTIRKDVIEEAKSLQLNASKAAENGIIFAIKKMRAEEWLITNKAAIAAHNQRIEKDGILLKPHWVSE